jgi:hypothetical protein
MSEYYVELQDSQGTCYLATDFTHAVVYFEDLDEARMFAKAQLDENFVLARVVQDQTDRVMDFFRIT